MKWKLDGKIRHHGGLVKIRIFGKGIKIEIWKIRRFYSEIFIDVSVTYKT